MATRKTPVKRGTTAPAKATTAPAARAPRSDAPRKRAVKAPEAARPAAPPPPAAALAPEARYRWIAQAAYLRAEKRGFAPGHEVDDWLAAEAEFIATYPPTAAD